MSQTCSENGTPLAITPAYSVDRQKFADTLADGDSNSPLVVFFSNPNLNFVGAITLSGVSAALQIIYDATLGFPYVIQDVQGLCDSDLEYQEVSIADVLKALLFGQIESTGLIDKTFNNLALALRGELCKCQEEPDPPVPDPPPLPDPIPSPPEPEPCPDGASRPIVCWRATNDIPGNLNTGVIVGACGIGAFSSHTTFENNDGGNWATALNVIQDDGSIVTLDPFPSYPQVLAAAQGGAQSGGLAGSCLIDTFVQNTFEPVGEPFRFNEGEVYSYVVPCPVPAPTPPPPPPIPPLPPDTFDFCEEYPDLCNECPECPPPEECPPDGIPIVPTTLVLGLVEDCDGAIVNTSHTFKIKSEGADA